MGSGWNAASDVSAALTSQPRVVAFADESMRRVNSQTVCYFMAAAVLPEARCDDTREALRPLARTRARRVHWRDEEQDAKAVIMQAIAALRVECLVVVGAMVDDRKQERARALVLRRVLSELDDRQVSHVMLESRHAERDRHDLRSVGAFRNARLLSRALSVTHGEPIQEPLLWVADAVAGAAGDQQCGRNALYGLLGDLVEHIDLGPV